LSPLASQHHLSEYSRIKYGYLGSPVQYAPLSIQVPHVVHELRERQVKYADQVLWWPCPSKPHDPPIIPASEQRAALSSQDSSTLHSQIQQELLDALSQSIPKPLATSSRSIDAPLPPTVKTSETHPIHISAIIPPESLVTISSNVTRCCKPSPVLFDIPPPYTLDRLTGYNYLFPSLANSPIIPVRSSYSADAQLSYTPTRPFDILHQHCSSITDALRTAICTKLSVPPLPLPLPRTQSPKNIKGRKEENAGIIDTFPKFLTSRKCLVAPLSTRSLSEPPVIFFPSAVDLFRPQKLGNLFLSSCPGKKVRLERPIRGKSAVYRSLELDLKRVRQVGVRCIVCCLDDNELQFLGTPWEEYYQRAHQEGLDILRIPLPEGLCPLSPQSLDADLTRIIQRYTMNGIPVLVHCRGGVGRAGLIACCWILKLGLCGWIETDVTGSSNASSKTDGTYVQNWDSETVVRRDTLQLVERVIGVVRVRRSVKAIETLEQVKFLVEYVDYLRTCDGSEDAPEDHTTILT
ncbi:phosphatases II, partial [Scleroderma citrinum]